MKVQGEPLDGVFEGGGVRGIGLVGALSVVEGAGYDFVNLAGTSAGAVVATLRAAGYRGAELQQVVNSVDFSRLTDTSLIGRIPLLGPLANLLGKLGIYEGDYFLGLMRKLLKDRGITTFADLLIPELGDDRYRFRVRVVASDLTRGTMLVLPQGLAAYGYKPEEFEVALAVRMSMSIPYFFRPVVLRPKKALPSYVVDGGLLSNFPVSLFDSPGEPAWPTFGFRLVESAMPGVIRHDIRGPISMLGAMFGTMMNAHDARYIETKDFVRTITIDTLGISSTHFRLSKIEKDALYVSGENAAREFLRTWDFDAYKARYRSAATPGRRALSAPAAVSAGTPA